MSPRTNAPYATLRRLAAIHPGVHRAESSPQSVPTRARRIWGLGLAAVALALLLGTLATTIVRSQNESRSHLQSNYRLRGESTATLVATYLSQQALHQRDSAERFLAGETVASHSLELIARALGSNAATLFDSHGRLLGTLPAKATSPITGTPPASASPPLPSRQGHPATSVSGLAQAESGGVTISGAVSLAGSSEPAIVIAVPFQTPHGKRVLNLAYGVASAELSVFVDHAITYAQHEVLLLDGAGRVLASSPGTSAATLSAADPALAKATSSSDYGSVVGARTPSTFTSAAVPGTRWRVVLAVPDSKLYSSIGGLASIIPWSAFAVVTLFSCLLMVLFSHLLSDRARLGTLSRELSRMARTDTLTGLLNRRGLNEHLTRATAYARRHHEPLSVLMIDLDRFKGVNDHYGHDAGDRVLCRLADCMRSVLRAEDVYGRIGGDEFMVILAGADEEAAQAATARLHHAVRQVDLGDIGLPDGIPMSVGSATALSTHPEQIQRAADVELYRVKGAKRAHQQATAAASEVAVMQPLPGPQSGGAAKPHRLTI